LLLLAVLCCFFLANVSSAGPAPERPAPAFDVNDHPDAPFVTRSRHFDTQEAAPKTGLAPKPVVEIPTAPVGAPGCAELRDVSTLSPQSRRMGACSARGPPRRV